MHNAGWGLIMYLLAQTGDPIDIEFVKFLLYGVSAALVGVAGFCVYLIVNVVVKLVPDTLATQKAAAEALEDNTEALKQATDTNRQVLEALHDRKAAP